VTCKGICLRHRAQEPVGSGRYACGQKRCQVCEIFIKWDLLSCPCCGFKLRTKTHNSILKKRFAEVKKYQDLRNKIQASIPVRY
jgi:hypothetical protein